MKQLLTIVFALYACLAYTQNAPDAASLLSGIESRIKSYGDFRVHLDIDGSNSTLTVSSDKFHLESADAEVWYDGTTLWSCMMQSDQSVCPAQRVEPQFQSHAWQQSSRLWQSDTHPQTIGRI